MPAEGGSAGRGARAVVAEGEASVDGWEAAGTSFSEPFRWALWGCSELWWLLP